MNITILPLVEAPFTIVSLTRVSLCAKQNICGLARSLVVAKEINSKKEHLGVTGTKILQQKDCRYLLTYLKKGYICLSVAGSLRSYCLLHLYDDDAHCHYVSMYLLTQFH